MGFGFSEAARQRGSECERKGSGGGFFGRIVFGRSRIASVQKTKVVGISPGFHPVLGPCRIKVTQRSGTCSCKIQASVLLGALHTLTSSFDLEQKGLASKHALLNQTRIELVRTGGVRSGTRWGAMRSMRGSQVAESSRRERERESVRESPSRSGRTPTSTPVQTHRHPHQRRESSCRFSLSTHILPLRTHAHTHTPVQNGRSIGRSSIPQGKSLKSTRCHGSEQRGHSEPTPPRTRMEGVAWEKAAQNQEGQAKGCRLKLIFRIANDSPFCCGTNTLRCCSPMRK